MSQIKLVFFITFSTLIFLSACETVSKKIDEKTIQEEKELTIVNIDPINKGPYILETLKIDKS